jgi:hypothetical protein
VPVTVAESPPLVFPVRDAPDATPLRLARESRRLDLQEAAARAGLGVEEARALEQAQLWRFADAGNAITAALVYASALGIDRREARRLAGLPVRPRLVEAWSLRRWAAVLLFCAASAAMLVLLVDVLRPRPATVVVTPPAPATPSLPAPSEIRVDVYNGTELPGGATRLANRVAGLAYRIGEMRNPTERDYPETRVYFPPGGRPIAERLAQQLGVKTTALPGGADPRRLVVIVGAR